MSKLWTVIRDKRNREVLGWLGGGLAVVIAGLWAAFVYFAPPKSSEPSTTNVEATSGGVAVGGNVSGSTITTGRTPDFNSAKKPK
jgi:hypothetical protein